MSDIYFTTKVASGKTFCNRHSERRILLNNIKKNQHTVVVAPRRYGKTSLICNALAGKRYPFAKIDLFCVVYEDDVCKKTAKGISTLIKQIASFSEKTLKVLEQCFKSVFIGLKAGQIELKVEFGNLTSTALEQLEDLLEGTEKLAAKHKRPVVLFFDEFQDVLKIDQTNELQAVIRSVAQHSKYVTYIFSGSSRVMLSKIFDDKNQPLYMLCDKIILDRIDKADFSVHIQAAAQDRWGRPLSSDLLETIFTLTELHPYYVNLLCNKLWELNSIPTLEQINSCWDKALFENSGKVIADLDSLNSNRIKVLTTIAGLGKVDEPNGKDFLDKVKLPLSSVQNAIKYLKEHDYLYEIEDGLKLTDPLMRKFVCGVKS